MQPTQSTQQSLSSKSIHHNEFVTALIGGEQIHWYLLFSVVGARVVDLVVGSRVVVVVIFVGVAVVNSVVVVETVVVGAVVAEAVVVEAVVV